MTQEDESSKSAHIEADKVEMKKVLVIAERERRLIYALLAHIAIVIFKASVRDDIRPILVFIHPVIILALVIFSARIFMCYYETMATFALVLLTLIPGINLIIWGYIIFKSHKFIKSKGFKVGLLGARLDDIKSAI